MRIKLPYREKEDESAKGYWTLNDIYGVLGDNVKAVYVSCPECGKVSHLKEHTVDAEGVSNPSYVCPYPPCTWHVWCDLENWKEVTKTTKQANEFLVLP